jgi:hypothetical protein
MRGLSLLERGAVKAIKETVQAYIETMIEQGVAIPNAKEIEIREASLVSVIL